MAKIRPKFLVRRRIPILSFLRAFCLSSVVGYICTRGPSIKYVTLFWPIFTPSPCHTLSHNPGPPESTSHILDPPIFSSTKILDKSPLYKFYLNCSQRFFSGGFV